MRSTPGFAKLASVKKEWSHLINSFAYEITHFYKNKNALPMNLTYVKKPFDITKIKKNLNIYGALPMLIWSSESIRNKFNTCQKKQQLYNMNFPFWLVVM